MVEYSTLSDGTTMERSLYDAYIEGLKQGIVQGALMMALPEEKNRGAFRQAQMTARLTEYAGHADTLWVGRKYGRFWPKVMPGGWPLPPEIPTDDATTWWPEIDGWPCPPPALRGEA